MNRQTLRLLLAFVSVAISPCIARAQTPAVPAPSGDAQNAGRGSTQNSAPPAAAKKVWTNEDVSGLRDQSVISTFSPANAKAAAPGAKTTPAKGKSAAWYREQITKLQANVPPLDRQIEELQAAIEGKPTGNGVESTRPRGVKIDSWPAELENLKTQREDLKARIDALYDEARRSGVPNSALPLQP